MKILIKVTKEILEMSQMCPTEDKIEDNPFLIDDLVSNCAVSMAIREILPNAKTYQGGITVKEKKGSFMKAKFDILLPVDVSDFLTKFDKSTPRERALMNPISFEVEVPNKLIHQIGISEVYKVLSESKTLELVTIK